jgi:hypothetical protein
MNDEFSHLLLADTLIQGRLANPVHPMWIHFEAFHVIMQPTYASMYPPAQGAFLALGRVLANEPFVGVCLSVALMCAAICWMLQGWLSPNWALLGGVLAIVRFGTFSYWANSYWGGAPAAIGGALAIGALIRILRVGGARNAVVLGVGLVMLALSRPFEGFVVGLALAVALSAWLFRQTKQSRAGSLRRVILPLTVVLVASAGAAMFYNWRVTGSPFRLPQQVNRETYAIAPYFVWQSPRPLPSYRHTEVREFYTGNEWGFYERQQAPGGSTALFVVKMIGLWCFYVGPALMLAIVVALATLPTGVRWRDLSSQTRLLVSTGMVFIAGLATEVFFLPHYAAPVTGIILAMVVLSLRRLRSWQWRGKPSGVFLTRALPLLCVLLVLLRAAAAPLHITLTPDWPATWYNLPPAMTERARVLETLTGTTGQHLVFVRYQSPSPSVYDWVYNAADIDQSKVVWARDMGPGKNADLMRYYTDRTAWLVEPDVPSSALRPYQP